MPTEQQTELRIERRTDRCNQPSVAPLESHVFPLDAYFKEPSDEQ